MAKILGLDLGTNSIGWAVVEKEKFVNAGVKLIEEVVALTLLKTTNLSKTEALTLTTYVVSYGI